MSDVLVAAEGVHKKFCRSLKRSLWYGMRDMGAELLGLCGPPELRKDEFWAVQGVSFELRRGSTLGLIGHNGAGKTTLLRMLNGLIKPDRGRINVRGRMQALIALGAGFNPLLTGRENIYVNAAVLGIPKAEVDRRFDDIVEFSGINDFIDAPVQSYSSGMTVRLGFAVAAHMNPDILLVDEVLAVGDYGFQSKCYNKIGELKHNGTGIILVSHNMHTISTFADRVMLLSKGRSTLFDYVPDGVRAYTNLFAATGMSDDIEKILSGNGSITFYDVQVAKRVLNPADSFSLSMWYEATTDYRDVDIDTLIYSSTDPWLYFQSTNKAYRRTVDLPEGRHRMQVTIKDIPLNNATAKIVVTIWTKNRTEKLFWWRIPVVFRAADYSTGNNFLQVAYEVN
ncbi:MAG: ABC transporter ATP-binding protein [Nitrospirota bacterium]